jgi:hypothetical protein
MPMVDWIGKSMKTLLANKQQPIYYSRGETLRAELFIARSSSLFVNPSSKALLIFRFPESGHPRSLPIQDGEFLILSGSPGE